MKKFIFLIIISLFLTVFSLIIHKNEICCMFGANRYFGYPKYMLSISKSTETYDEADQVNYLPTFDLMKKWRKIYYNTIYGSGISWFLINFCFYFWLICVFYLIYISYKKLKK